jgi:hypothetical protein
VPSVAGQEGEGAEETSRAPMKITAFWSASVSNSIHYVLGPVCGSNGLCLLTGAAGAVCAVVIKIKEEAMKNEEVVNLFKRYWGYQRLVKRFVIAIEAVLFVFLIYEVLFGPKPIDFFGFLLGVLWVLFVLFVVYVIASSAIEFVMNITVGTAFRYRAVEMLQRQFGRLIRSDFERTWLVNPGIFSIDCRDKYLLVSSSSTEYDAIRLDAGNIVSSKVERSVFVETKTVYGQGSLSDVVNRTPVSRSSSISRESIVLEITYKGSDNLPYVVSIPFDEDRISAERAQYMIQMFA